MKTSLLVILLSSMFAPLLPAASLPNFIWAGTEISDYSERKLDQAFLKLLKENPATTVVIMDARCTGGPIPHYRKVLYDREKKHLFYFHQPITKPAEPVVNPDWSVWYDVSPEMIQTGIPWRDKTLRKDTSHPNRPRLKVPIGYADRSMTGTKVVEKP